MLIWRWDIAYRWLYYNICYRLYWYYDSCWLIWFDGGCWTRSKPVPLKLYNIVGQVSRSHTYTHTHTHTHTHTGTHTRGGTHRHDSYRMFPFDIMNFSRPAKKEKEKLEREQKQKVARPVAETHAGRLQLLFHFISFHFVSLALKRAVNKCRRRNRMKEEVETEEMKWENGERKEREKMTMFLAPLLRPPLSSTRHMFVLPVTFVTRFLLLANI